MEKDTHLSDFDAIKPDLRRYLKDQVRAYRDHPENGTDIAYHIAGQLSNDALRGAPDDDPYIQILVLASQLELPPAHQAKGSSWDSLIAMVEAL